MDQSEALPPLVELAGGAMRDILASDQSGAGSAGIFSRWTNQTHKARAYSHDGPKRGAWKTGARVREGTRTDRAVEGTATADR
eukprot:1136933-Prorocentrum_minimum.AAC.1